MPSCLAAETGKLIIAVQTLDFRAQPPPPPLTLWHTPPRSDQDVNPNPGSRRGLLFRFHVAGEPDGLPVAVMMVMVVVVEVVLWSAAVVLVTIHRPAAIVVLAVQWPAVVVVIVPRILCPNVVVMVVILCVTIVVVVLSPAAVMMVLLSAAGPVVYHTHTVVSNHLRILPDQ